MAKIRRREAVKEKYDKERRERLKLEMVKREEKMRRCNTQKKEIRKEENERRLDILDYQYELLRRSKKKEKMGELRRINAGQKTITIQMDLQKNLSAFYRRMNRLKSQSIYKKTFEQRYKIYKDLKKAEAERKRKELEEKMDKLLNK